MYYLLIYLFILFFAAICYGFEVMTSVESPNTIFSIL